MMKIRPNKQDRVHKCYGENNKAKLGSRCKIGYEPNTNTEWLFQSSIQGEKISYKIAIHNIHNFTEKN